MAPSTFDHYGPNKQMSFAPNVPNISTGKPVIDQALSMLMMGSGFAPRPMAGQSIMDTHIQRKDSMDFLATMRSSFSGSQISQKLGGVDTNSSWGSMVSSFLGNPDGVMDNPIVKAFNGGKGRPKARTQL